MLGLRLPGSANQMATPKQLPIQIGLTCLPAVIPAVCVSAMSGGGGLVPEVLQGCCIRQAATGKQFERSGYVVPSSQNVHRL